MVIIEVGQTQKCVPKIEGTDVLMGSYDNDNDNDNILFHHNIQIEIIMYNSLENQIIDWSGDYY